MANPIFLTSFTAETALETPQILVRWEFDQSLVADIRAFTIRRDTVRWPESDSEGEAILHWDEDQDSDLPTHVADTDIEPMTVYYYTAIIEYRKDPFSWVVVNQTPLPFNSRWSGQANGLAWGGEANGLDTRMVISGIDAVGVPRLWVMRFYRDLVDQSISMIDALQAGEDVVSLGWAGPLGTDSAGYCVTSFNRVLRFSYDPTGAIRPAPSAGWPVDFRVVTGDASATARSVCLEFQTLPLATPDAVTVLDNANQMAYRLDPTNGASLSVIDLTSLPDVSDLRTILFDHDNQRYGVASGRRIMWFDVNDAAPNAGTLLANTYMYDPPQDAGYFGNHVGAIQQDGRWSGWELDVSATPRNLLSHWVQHRAYGFSGRQYPDPAFSFRDKLYGFLSERMRRSDHTPRLPVGDRYQRIVLSSPNQSIRGRLEHYPIVPGSVVIYDEGSPVTELIDNGSGALIGSGGHYGSVDYRDGSFEVVFSPIDPAIPVGDVRAQWQQSPVSWRGDRIAHDMPGTLYQINRLCRFIGLWLDRLVDYRDWLPRQLDPDTAPPDALPHLAYRSSIPDLDPNMNLDRQRLYLYLYPEVIKLRGTLSGFKLLLKFYGYLLDFYPSQIIPSRQFLDSTQADPPGYPLDYPTNFDTSGGLFVINFKLKFRRIADGMAMPEDDPVTQFLLGRLEKIKPLNAILTYQEA